MMQSNPHLLKTACVAICVLHTVALVGCAEAPKSASPGTVLQTRRTTPELSYLESEEPLRPWKFIILHHTATTSGSLDSIDFAHQQRRDSAGNSWRGIGYHFLIGNGNGMEDGKVQSTFRWHEQIGGAHAGIREYNEHGIGICLVGNFEQNGPTSAQIKAVSELVGQLKQRFDITEEQILKHGDLKATACPGRLFPFQKIASIPPAGVQLVENKTKGRFSRGEPTHMEGIKNVAAIQRANSTNRTESKRDLNVRGAE